MPTRRQVGKVFVCGAVVALTSSPFIRPCANRALAGSSRGDTTGLQRKFDSARDGDTVVIAGDYVVTSPIVVRRKRLTLRGAGARVTSTLPHSSDWFQFIDCDVTFDGDWTFAGTETLAVFTASTPKTHKDISAFVCFERGRPEIRPGFKSSGKRCAVKLMRCANGLVEGLIHNGFMRDDHAPGPVGSNFAPAIYVEGGAGNTVRDCSAYHSGSLATAGFNTQGLAVEGGGGENFKDNGVYISSGTGCTVRGVEVAGIAGFGSGVKVRGSRNRVLDCTVTDTGNGVSMTGNGPRDAFGANGYGNLCRGNVVRSYRYHAFTFGVQDGFYQRDLTFSDCSAVGSRKAAGYAAFVVSVTSGLQMQGITVDGYDGTSFAGVISGALQGRPATNIRVDGVRFRNAAAVPEALRLQSVDAASIRNVAGENIGPHLIEGRDVTRSEFVGLRHPGGSYLTLAKRYRNAGNRFSGGVGVPVLQ